MSEEEQEKALRDTLVAIRNCRKEIAGLQARIDSAKRAYGQAHHLVEFPSEVDKLMAALPQPDDVARWVHEHDAAKKELDRLERLERDM